MDLAYAPRTRAPTTASHDSSATDTGSDTELASDSALGPAAGWGNQAINALLSAGKAAVPWLAPMAGAVQSEGWAALLDGRDALAREEGREALAGRMTVLKDGEQGTGAPNEVSPEELEQLATLYADIQNGNCNLKIDTEALGWQEGDAFQEGVMGDVVSLMQTKSGRLVLDELAYNGKDHVTTLERGSSPEKAEERAASYSDGHGLNGAEGTDTTVSYVPGATVVANPASWGTYRSDVVLAHELTHAWYDTRGETDVDQVPLCVHGRGRQDAWLIHNWEHQGTGLGAWDDAPVSENAYRAERAALADTAGALEGDQGMPQRDRYLYDSAAILHGSTSTAKVN